MARERGVFNFSANLEVKKEGALDARTVIQTKAELIDTATWYDEDNRAWLYNGLLVAVVADGDNNGVYALTNKDEFTIASNWVKISSFSVDASIDEILNQLEYLRQNYLPLSGGTMTGNIIFPKGTVNDVKGITTDDNHLIVGHSSSSIELGSWYEDTYIRSANDLFHRRGTSNIYTIWDTYNLPENRVLRPYKTFTTTGTPTWIRIAEFLTTTAVAIIYIFNQYGSISPRPLIIQLTGDYSGISGGADIKISGYLENSKYIWTKFRTWTGSNDSTPTNRVYLEGYLSSSSVGNRMYATMLSEGFQDNSQIVMETVAEDPGLTGYTKKEFNTEDIYLSTRNWVNVRINEEVNEFSNRQIHFYDQTNYVAAKFYNLALATKAINTYIEWWQTGDNGTAGWFNFKLGSLESTSAIISDGLITAKAGIQIGHTTDYGWFLNSGDSEYRLTAGKDTAKGINVKDLLVSNFFGDYTKVPINGIYSKGNIILGENSLIQVPRVKTESAAGKIWGDLGVNDIREIKEDGQTVDWLPSDMGNKAVTPIFHYAEFPSGDWVSGLVTKGWFGDTYSVWEIAGPAGGTHTIKNLYYRTSSGIDTWNAWETIAAQSWVNTQLESYLPLTAGTEKPLTGLLCANRGVQIGGTTDVGWYPESGTRILAGNNQARGVNVGNLLVSNAWSDASKVPTNGIYSKGNIVLGTNSGIDFISNSTSSWDTIDITKSLTSTNSDSTNAPLDYSVGLNVVGHFQSYIYKFQLATSASYTETDNNRNYLAFRGYETNSKTWGNWKNIAFQDWVNTQIDNLNLEGQIGTPQIWYNSPKAFKYSNPKNSKYLVITLPGTKADRVMFSFDITGYSNYRSWKINVSGYFYATGTELYASQARLLRNTSFNSKYIWNVYTGYTINDSSGKCVIVLHNGAETYNYSGIGISNVVLSTGDHLEYWGVKDNWNIDFSDEDISTIIVPETMTTHELKNPLYEDALISRNLTINGTAYTFYSSTSSAVATIYSPTSAGTSSYLLQSTGGTPTWVSQTSICAGALYSEFPVLNGSPSPSYIPENKSRIFMAKSSLETSGSWTAWLGMNPYSGTDVDCVSAIGVTMDQETNPKAFIACAQGNGTDTSGWTVKQLATTEYVDNVVAGGGVDLSNYVTRTELNSTLSSYATQSWVTDRGYLTSSSLSGYATQSWVQQQGYLTSIPSNYVTDSELTATLGDYHCEYYSNPHFLNNIHLYMSQSGTTGGWTGGIYWCNRYNTGYDTACDVGGMEILGDGDSISRVSIGVAEPGENLYNIINTLRITKTNATWNSYTLATWGSSDATSNHLYTRTMSVNGTSYSTFVGTSNTALPTIYAPTTVGTNKYVLQSNGSGAPSWVNPIDLIVGKSVRTDSITDSGTDDDYEVRILTQSEYDALSTKSNYTIYLVTD